MDLEVVKAPTPILSPNAGSSQNEPGLLVLLFALTFEDVFDAELESLFFP